MEQEKIEPSDYKNLLKLGKFLKADKAFLITKNLLGEREIEDVKMKMIPACLLYIFILFNSSAASLGSLTLTESPVPSSKPAR